MHEAKAQAVDELRYFAEDVSNSNCKIYHLLTASALEKLIAFNKEHNMQNHFYELMACSDCTYPEEDQQACKNMLKTFGSRLYLDIEFPADADFLDFQMSQTNPLQIGASVAKDIHTFLEKKFKCKCKIVVLKSHRSTKYSWHMICITTKDGVEYLFQDSLAVLHAINLWFEETDLSKYIYYKEKDIEENIIDVSVYSRHKCYRTLHSSKYMKKIPLQFATYYPIEKTTIPPPFEDTLCMQLLKGRKLHNLAPIQSSTKLRTHVNNQNSKKRKSTTSLSRKKHVESKYNRAAEMFFSNWSLWQDIKSFIKTKFPSAEFEKCSYKNIELIYLSLDRDFRCPHKRGSGTDGAHKSNHSCLWIKPRSGFMDWRCHDAECQRKNVFKTIPFPMDLQMRLKKVYTSRYPVTIMKKKKVYKSSYDKYNY